MEIRRDGQGTIDFPYGPFYNQKGQNEPSPQLIKPPQRRKCGEEEPQLSAPVRWRRRESRRLSDRPEGGNGRKTLCRRAG